MKQTLATGLALAMVLASVSARGEAPPPDPKANPTKSDMKQARSLFNNGQDLFADGDYEAAITAFRRAYQLSGEPNCLYNISLTLEKMEEYGEAADYLKYYRAYRSSDEQAELEEKITELEEQQAQADAEAEAARAAAEAAKEPPPPEPTPPPEDDTGPRVFGPAAIATTAVSVVAFGIATGLGAMSLRRRSVAASACGLDPDGDRFCPADAAAPLHDSKRFALGADISIGIGAAAALATVIIVAVNATRRKKARKVALSPTGISVRF